MYQVQATRYLFTACYSYPTNFTKFSITNPQNRVTNQILSLKKPDPKPDPTQIEVCNEKIYSVRYSGFQIQFRMICKFSGPKPDPSIIKKKYVVRKTWISTVS